MPPAEPAAQTPPATPAVPKQKILSIEDEPFISELYSRALTKAGYDVTVEHDGKAGLELAQTDHYDFILLDLLLPTMHGTEILKRLRDPEVENPVHAKIIVMTNFEDRKEVREQIERLADAYLIKVDVTPNQLVDFLKQIK